MTGAPIEREELVTVDDGVQLWTATRGSGPPFVICHGGPGWWSHEGPLAAMVDDMVTVHRWDQRGAGRSSPVGPFTVDRFVADLEALREHFGYEQWIVGGHSWGANLALMYALAHPQRVQGLAYICGGLGMSQRWRDDYNAGRLANLTPEQQQRFQELRSRPRNEEEEREERLLNSLADFADRSRAAELATQLYDDQFQANDECNRTLNEETRGWDEDEITARCASLRMPVLIIHGESDPRPVWATDPLVKAIRRMRRIMLPGVGHIPWVERPEMFEASLRAFLGELQVVELAGFRKGTIAIAALKGEPLITP